MVLDDKVRQYGSDLESITQSIPLNLCRVPLCRHATLFHVNAIVKWSARSLQVADTSFAAIAIASPAPASQNRAMTACCAARTSYAPRWAANPTPRIGSHPSQRRCGNGPIKESGLRLSGARTKQTRIFSANLVIFSAQRNVRCFFVRLAAKFW